MKKVGSLLFALMMLLNVSFGYTLTISYNGNDTVREVEGGEAVIVGLSSREEANYVVDSGNAILKIFGNRRQFVMPEEDVNISVALKEGTGSDSSTTVDILNMQVGDYVEYTPSATMCDLTAITGVTQDAFNPSAITQWRVLSNDGTTVELVSADSVGDLTLGATSNRSANGIYNSGSIEEEELAKSQYVEIGRILREISEAYVDGNLAIAGRGLGYKAGSSVEEIDTTTYPITWENSYANASTGIPYIDTYYNDDVNVLMNNNMLHSNGYVWLASRGGYAYSTASRFAVRCVNSNGHPDYSVLYCEFSDNSAYSGSYTHPLRPVVILKPGSKATPVGTEGNSWKLKSGEGNTSTTYTVSYNGNGGMGTTASSVHTYGTASTLTVNGFSREGYVFESWNSKADGSGIKYTNEQAVKFVYGTTAENTVTLYAQWREPYFAELAKVGDYVEYTPSATTCDLTEITGITQNALNPSATTQWRVLSNDGTTVELVSADTVGTLTLAVDTYTSDGGLTFDSGSAEGFELSKEHYGNAIQILKQISEAYTDGEIAIAGRGLGWNGTSVETISVDNISFDYINTNSITEANGDPYDDSYYQKNGTLEDVVVLIENDMMHSTTHSSYVWLTSRALYVGSDEVKVAVRFMTADELVYDYYLFRENSGGYAYSSVGTLGVRPVVILKSEITATAVGAEGNSWKLN